jgi:DNA-directed RNA polymerase specialized sigma24 family protein
MAEGELSGVEPPAPDRFDDQFHKEWMRGLFERALADLREVCVAEGREKQYAVFARYDLEAPASGTHVQYADLARELGVPVTQVTSWLHWARARLRVLVLARLRELCVTDEEFRWEARALFGVEP